METGTDTNLQKRNESFTTTVKSGSDKKKSELDNESSSESQSLESSKQSKQSSLKEQN